MTAKRASLLAILLLLCAESAYAGERTGPVSLGVGAGADISMTAASRDGAVLIAGTGTGATFISRDRGSTWEVLRVEAVPPAAVSAALFDPEDTKTLYLAVGPTLVVSSDQGRTWKPFLDTTPLWKSEPVVRMCMEEVGKKSMYAATKTTLYRGEDKGKRWRPVNSISGQCVGIVSLATHTYAAAGSNVYETADGGYTWGQKRIADPGSRISSLTGGYTRGGRMVIFAAVPGTGIVGSENMGRTWSTVFKEPSMRDVAMAPGQDKSAIAASEDSAWRTDNGGGQWIKCFSVASNGAPKPSRLAWTQMELGRSLSIVPGAICAAGPTSGTVLIGTTGELFTSRDAGVLWTPVSNRIATAGAAGKGNFYASSGLNASSPWELYIDPRKRQVMMIAYSESGFALSTDRGAAWLPSVKGSPSAGTFYCLAFDPFTDGKVFAAVADQGGIPGWEQLAGPTGSGGIAVSEDYGRTWRPAGTGLPNKPCTWVTVDPTSTKGSLTLYATAYGDGVYKSVDAGKSWVSVSEGLGSEGNKNAFMVKVHPRSGEVLCAITGKRSGDEPGACGGLWRSTNGGDTWEDITSKLNLRWPCGFDFDPRVSGVIYLTARSTEGNQEGGLYKTTTAGASWVKVFSSSDLAPARQAKADSWFVSVSPHTNEVVYLSTLERGLYYSSDTGTSWQKLEWVPADCVTRVSFAALEKESVYVGTIGAGVWKGPSAP